MKVLALAVCVFAALASASTLIPPSTVLGTEAIGSATGPSVTLATNAALTDTLTLTASGEVFLQAGNTYGTNAAGVITTAGTSPVGATGMCPCPSFNWGSLLIGNSSLGFFQIFPADATNGLGSGAPPQTLSTAITLGSLGFASALPAGTVLQFRIADTITSDNGGSFNFSGSIGSVPEPASLALVGIGLIASTWLRRRAG